MQVATKLILAGVFLVAGGILYSAHALKVEAAEEGWLSDYQMAREVAKQSGKPILLVFR